MRSFQEFKGQSTRLDYDRERGEFIARPVRHPFVVRNAASEVQTESIEPGGSFGIAAVSRPLQLRTRQDLSRDEPLAGYEDSVWTRAVVGLALAGIVIWVGFVVSQVTT